MTSLEEAARSGEVIDLTLEKHELAGQDFRVEKVPVSVVIAIAAEVTHEVSIATKGVLCRPTRSVGRYF